MVNNKEYMQYEGGSMKVYTGPKGGKFVINKKAVSYTHLTLPTTPYV